MVTNLQLTIADVVDVLVLCENDILGLRNQVRLRNSFPYHRKHYYHVLQVMYSLQLTRVDNYDCLFIIFIVKFHLIHFRQTSCS